MNDVVIVGAGPSGLSAAIVCAQYGLKVKIFDEYMKPGGRLLGQLHQEPDGVWWNGIDEAKKLFEQATELGVQVECGISVYNIEVQDGLWEIHTSQGITKAPMLLLATGAAEVPAPIPGWTLPGVLSIGAAQVMTNVQRVKVGDRGIVIGINVLSVAITRELQLAGIEVDRILLPSLNPLNEQAGSPEKVMESMLRFAHLAPSKLIGFGSRLMKGKLIRKFGLKFYPKNGVKLWGIPLQLRKAVLEIVGTSHVEGVRVANITPTGDIIKNSEEYIPVDFVCISGGLYPLAELAAVAGCPFHFIPELGGHIPLHNEYMKTPLKGLYVAGNITGIESAKVAMVQGRVAGLSIVRELCGATTEINQELDKAIEEVGSVRKHAVIQFHPNIENGRNILRKQWEDQEVIHS